MARPLADDLVRLSTKAYDRLRSRLAEPTPLTDEEYLWEPAPGAWTVRAAADVGGRLRSDFALMPEAPVPITTIAWRLMHIVDLLTEERCTEQLGLPPDESYDPRLTTSADEARAMLDGAIDTWRGYLERTDEERLLEAIPGQRWNDPLTFALHIIDEFIHHAAEVALLRDLYQARHADVSSEPTLAVLASHGHWDAALAAVEAGADPNPTGVTASPLHHAAGMGKIDLVRALVEHGAATDATDGVYRVTPLVWAKTMGPIMGGPAAIGADYDAVIEYLSAR